ncbi:type II secretion system protein N [Sandarakinorhabdus sp.]|uniref:type II secretion system protein N n=1 Tax=Sandarakinorhabdus sp. TaxID=1916663 RepID=UPI00286D9E8C|nr:type II secretion system protein N [Sandarakinorhabdus sp.]
MSNGAGDSAPGRTGTPAKGDTLLGLTSDKPVMAQILTLAQAVLAALLLAALARLIWAVVTPAGPLGDGPAMASSAVPVMTAAGPDPFNRSAAADGPGGGMAEVSSLDLILSGTRVDTVSGRGSAIIAAADGVQQSYGVGDEILPGVTLKAVEFDAVTLSRGGRDEQLFLDQSSAAPLSQLAPGQQPAPRLAADLAMVPRLAGTRVTGLILNPKGSGAAFAAAGLQSGDVLVAVDGTPVSALGDPAALARRLDAGGLPITIERGGAPITLRLANK